MNSTINNPIPRLKNTLTKLTALVLIMCAFATNTLHSDNIALAVVATGKYIGFVDPLIESANKHFCKNHHVTYYVFTDQDYDPPENTIVVPHQRMGWPYDTMMRYHGYYANRDLFDDQDYIFAIDADMLFLDEVGDEILSDHTAVMHPGYVGRRGTYETDPKSTACVRPNEGQYYFCGGVYGGSRDRFFHICKTNIDNIATDLSKGIIALWHDESHWNRYCIDHKPALILTPSYCFPETGNYGNWHPRISALTKRNVSDYRN